MIKIKIKNEKSETEECPKATQNIELNLENRQIAINKYGYGPANPSDPSEEFWAKKAKMWKEDVETAKTMRCGNCKAFDISNKMKDCIKKGLGAGEESQADNYDSLVKDLGYCGMLKFKCAASRTCNAWITKEEA